MNPLPTEEQAAIDAADHDGEGWALSADTPPTLREALSSKGMIRLWQDRWQLTPHGFAHAARFK